MTTREKINQALNKHAKKNINKYSTLGDVFRATRHAQDELRANNVLVDIDVFAMYDAMKKYWEEIIN